jgi:predicted O-methyltransferase YrrM
MIYQKMSIKYIDARFDYANMYNWTNDLPEDSIHAFLSIINYINTKDVHTQKHILEIGTFVGTSAIKLVEMITNADITVIDMWEDYKEVGGMINTVDKIKENNIERIFYQNIETSGLKHLFTIKKGNSFDVLLDLVKDNMQFNVIYVDGSHTLLDSYADILLSFELLQIGGVMIIDDVPFNKGDVLNSPLEAVKYFVQRNEKRITILHSGYRLFLEKLS